ncbi:PPA1309 family protein [Actinocorallia sp. A-T 12471]|uniref:PPA1309 family protein n=1 Tax=Actinocorallia sp. A-T 12471 TaxID=3089813 RepID=UPI0029D25725|nr:PPA1309 family protein [Actinocorallia sp. A-T 12471]MDX6738850.1 PPA1309 family protein [Actinocorallia sp. A-T 12471]
MTPLEETVRSIEAQTGWDGAPRLFALVETAELIRAEPDLAQQLGLSADDAITAVDQGDLEDGDVGALLPGIVWPDNVAGAALAMVRVTLPPEIEDEIPAEGDAVAWALAHPRHEELRIVAGVLRDGSRHAVLRIRSHEEELLSADDLVPDVTDALAGTLLPDEG